MAKQESGQTNESLEPQADLAEADDSQVSDSAQQEDDSNDGLESQFADTVSQLREERKRVEDALKKAQSSKDKQFANQQKVINELQESVVTLSQLIRQRGDTSQSTSRGNVEQDGASESVKSIFADAYGLDIGEVENTQEYIDFVKTNGSNISGVDGVTKASRFVLGRIKSGGKSTTAVKAQSPGGGGVGRDAGAVVAEIDRITSDRTLLTTHEGRAHLKELRQELQQLEEG